MELVLGHDMSDLQEDYASFGEWNSEELLDLASDMEFYGGVYLQSKIKRNEKKEYKFHEITQVAEKFEKIFGVRFKDYYDGIESVLFKKIVVDIIKFDEYLLKKYRYNEDKEISMSAFILNKFGVDAWYFFKSLLP